MVNEKSFLSGEEVCKLIETCAKKGVISMKYGPLELYFSPAQEKQAPGPTIPAPIPENIIRDQKIQEVAALEADELSLREFQVAELQITDPSEYEKLMEAGELQESEEGNDADTD